MSRSQSPLLKRAIFILGARRSGTYWLQRIVTAHSRIGAVPSETHLFSHGIRPLMDRLEGAEVGDPTVGRVHADREAVLDAVRDLCDIVFAPYRAGEDGWVSERTPLHVYHLGLIAAVYPDAKIVHIVRDGRDVARSLVEQGWGPTTHEAAAMEWRDAIRSARAADLPAASYRELRYEELIAGADRLLGDLFGWLEVPATDSDLQAAAQAAAEVANTASGRPGAQRWREELSRRQVAQIERTAGPELELMGYPLSGR